MPRRTRDHAGETYGALVVGDKLPDTGHRGTPARYTVRWTCCDTETVMGQANLNARRPAVPGQCIECRWGGKPPTWIDPNRLPGDHTPAEKVIVQHPTWGRLMSLTGWPPESRIDRAWAMD